MKYRFKANFAFYKHYKLLSATFLLFSGISIAEEPRVVSSHLQQLQHEYASYQGGGAFTSSDATVNIVRNNHVMLTVTSTVDQVPQTIERLKSLGMTHIAHYKHLISGVLPISQLSKLDSVKGVQWVSSQRATASSSGLAHNSGDAAMFSDVVKKQQGVDGSGMTIGVMSDSYNCLEGAEADVLSGDLPDDVEVIKEYSFCAEGGIADEGRAMMQLIHDIAPGAKLMFYTAFESPVDFSRGIRTLAAEGADIIVDDVSWLLMPMIQAGPIAQAVNEVERRGVAYFSAAGNQSRLSYQHAYKETVTASGALAHDFGRAAGTSSDVYQKITLPKDVAVTIVLQWVDPARIAGGKGAKTDLDLFVFDSQNNKLIASSQDNNIGNDPFEILAIEATEEGVSEANLFIRRSAGGDPAYVKYVMFSTGSAELVAETVEAEQLYFDEDGDLVTADGKPMKGGIAVVIIPGYSGVFSVSQDLVQIGPGGAPLITNQSNGQQGIVLEGGYYPINGPIWFVPDGYSAELNGQNEVVLIDESAGIPDQTDVRIAEYATQSSTIYGHANAEGAIAVGAMSYRQSPWFNGSSLIERFSSAGGLPLVFNTRGDPLKKLIFYSKPEIIAIDDVDTTFFPFIAEETDSDQSGFPNFQGTSAAAPNAAAVAALLLQKYAYLKPRDVRHVMMHGTIDLEDPANVQGEFVLANNPCATDIQFDWGTGCGLIQTDLIFDVAKDLYIKSGFGDFNDDGCVDAKDRDILVGILRSSADVQETYDLTGDGKITNRDFDALESLYGHGCSG